MLNKVGLSGRQTRIGNPTKIGINFADHLRSFTVRSEINKVLNGCARCTAAAPDAERNKLNRQTSSILLNYECFITAFPKLQNGMIAVK